jgi:hypothetical protein
MHGANQQVRDAAHRIVLNDLVSPALARLLDLLEDRDTPPSVVLGAIREILTRTGYGEPISNSAVEAEIARLEAEEGRERVATHGSA